MKIKKIYTKKMAVYLRERGFKILGTEVNPNKPEFDVYLFENTPDFEAAMLEYVGKFCSDKKIEKRHRIRTARNRKHNSGAGCRNKSVFFDISVNEFVYITHLVHLRRENGTKYERRPSRSGLYPSDRDGFSLL